MLKTSRRAWWVGGWWFCIALAALSFSAFADEPAAASSPPTDQVDALINQLGDVDFKTREAATDKLLAMGSAALPALKAAITSAGPFSISRAMSRFIPSTCSVARGIRLGSCSASTASFSPSFFASSRNRIS